MRPQSCTQTMRVDLRDAGLDVHFDLGELHAARAAGRQARFPLAVHRHRLGAEQAAGVLPGEPLRRRRPSDWMRPFAATSEVAGSRRSSAPRARRARRAPCPAVTRIAGVTDARRRAAAAAAAERVVAVADLGLDRRRSGRPSVSAATIVTMRARADADVLRAAAHDDAAVREDLAVRLRAAPAAAPLVRRAAHAALDRARRRVAGRVAPAPAELLRGNREVLAATSRSALPAGRFFMRNSTGSIWTLSASSSISISVWKQPCGWPGARIARAGPAFV